MTMRYATPAAFKQALEHRLRAATVGSCIESFPESASNPQGGKDKGLGELTRAMTVA